MHLDMILIPAMFSITACHASQKLHYHIKLIHLILNSCLYALICNFYEQLICIQLYNDTMHLEGDSISQSANFAI